MIKRWVLATQATAFLLATVPASAQQGTPLKPADRILDKRSLTIPGKLPSIAKADPKLKKALKRKRRKKKSAKGVGENKAGSNSPALPSRKGHKPEKAEIKKTARRGCKPLNPDDSLQFEFKGADIKDVVSAISKTMCKNFIITSKVRSQKFDILSPEPITVGEAWRAFLSALEVNDFTLVKVGAYYKIIQSNDGVRSTVPMYGVDEQFPANERFVTKIWRPKYSDDSNAIVTFLNIFKSAKGKLHPHRPTGVIIATDYGSNLRRLEQIFHEIDRPGALERVHILPVEYASAQEIADKLSKVFSPGGGKGKNAPLPGENEPSVSQIIPDERTNRLLIIASRSGFEQIKELKRQLDIPGDGGDGLVHVLRLRHANAEELASTLGSLASGGSSSSRSKRAGGKASGRPSTPPGAAALFSGDVKVTADKPTNSLVVTASKIDFESMRRVIERLDVPRLQVFVEAVILEVTVGDERNLGVSWHGGHMASIGGKDTPIVFGSAPSSDLNSLSLTANPVQLVSTLGFATLVRGPVLEGSEDFIAGGIPAAGVVLNALAGSTDVNIVATPHLLTMDNEEAEIEVSERIPFSSGLTLGGGGISSALGGLAASGAASGAAGAALGSIGGLGLGSVNFSYEDVGLTLKLKPQINDDKTVRLEIDQQLSDVGAPDSITGQRTTSKRAAKTVVAVRDQDTIVIGGLVRETEAVSEDKVPLLGDLPILGWLFKTQSRERRKTNLLLVLTPYIIRDGNDFRKIYERKMAERKEFVDRFYGTTAEYRSSIDWTRKSGPLARYRQLLRAEMDRAENGGAGVDGELIIRSEEEDEDGTAPQSTDDPSVSG